jgi:hypothetical protein
VTPITSAPVRAASAATTDESTPPDIATTIRAEAASFSRSKRGSIAAVLYSKFTLSG